jgi:hypothetical protein
MVEFPAETPETIPVFEIVATAVFEETQGFTAAGLAEPVKVVLAPTQAESVPEIVGLALIVTKAVTTHPFELV